MFQKKLLFVLTLAFVFSPAVSLADVAYKWEDKNGRIHFGNNPPRGARAVVRLKGKSFSRYSSERMLSRYRRPSESLGESDEVDGARAMLGVETPEEKAPPVEEKPQAPNLVAGSVELLRDENMEIASFRVPVENRSDGDISDIRVNLRFTDGSLLPTVGPKAIAPRSSAIYELPADIAPSASVKKSEIPQPEIVIEK